MPKKEQWITGKRAAEILTEQSGHPISQDYVRLLAKKGKIRSQPIDGRTKEYHEGDVRAYRVRAKTWKEATVPASDPDPLGESSSWWQKPSE